MFGDLQTCGKVSCYAFGDLQTCGTVSSDAFGDLQTCGTVSSDAFGDLHSCKLKPPTRSESCIPANGSLRRVRRLAFLQMEASAVSKYLLFCGRIVCWQSDPGNPWLATLHSHGQLVAPGLAILIMGRMPSFRPGCRTNRQDSRSSAPPPEG